MQAERPEVARKDSSGRVTERITDMAGTLAEKVWDAHVVRRGTNGAPDLLYIDLHLVHEVEVDVEEVRRAVRAPSHDVRVPDLLRQRAGHLLGPFSRSYSRPGVWFSRLVCRRTCISAFETPISTYGQL